MRILIVEDEVQLSEALGAILEKNNYIVDRVFDGESGLDYILSDIYDGVILDIMLPKLNGIEVLKKARKERISTPIILLTAKGEVEDRIIGLDCGADDYLPKPFYVEELMARIRALTRRKGEVQSDNLLSYGDITLNIGNLELGSKENEVVNFLKYNANRALENLGFEKLYTVDAINPIVLNGLSTETKTHDFFSTKGNGYQKGVYEELEDEDFII